ncbi:MFS transporter [Actinoallomurus soli]|uniref:MFS transporter n=1 Tax=Actinoallomurus soli TaxID=2952535 RepID=UPI0038739D03
MRRARRRARRVGARGGAVQLRRPRDGPVLITIAYRVSPQNRTAFLAAVPDLERARRRTGARRWRLYRDGAGTDRYVETYITASWAEHLRQHNDRWTGSDQDVLARVLDLTTGEPEVDHLFPADRIEGSERTASSRRNCAGSTPTREDRCSVEVSVDHRARHTERVGDRLHGSLSRRRSAGRARPSG